MRLIFDLETNGLLEECTKIHCAILQDVDSSWSKFFVNDYREFFNVISNPKNELIGHNIFDFDLLVLKKLYNWIPDKNQKLQDTYLMSQLIFPDLKTDDSKKDIFPGHIFSKKETGSHSLKAWGQRVMCYKGEYTGGWEEYNDDMGSYCIQDGNTTKVLFNFLEVNIPNAMITREPLELEYSIAPILSRQHHYGVNFNVEKADKLVGDLTFKMVELRQELQNIFHPRWVNCGSFIPKRNDKLKGYTKDAEFTKIKLEEFNPSSRTQIVDRLIKEYKWNPEEFTENGNVKMDEDIIENLPFKELKPLKDYLTIKKRISQIETGRQAWIKRVDSDGRIRGSIRQNGAVTGRMSHFSPNLAQVPSNDSLYGRECRELFEASTDKVLIGCDADSLEMRCLAGYLKSLDNGRFMASILHGSKEDGTDPHTINMHAYEIENRDCAKTEFYGDIYGSKNAKKGKILLDYGINITEYTPDFEKDVNGMLEWLRKKNEKARAEGKPVTERTRAYWECWVAGKHLAGLFGNRIPEMQQLRDKIHAKVVENGYVKGLDGRKLTCRAQHSELNTVLQSAGAIIMKKALYIADTKIQELGYKPGIDYEFILNIHDELEIEVTNTAEMIDNISRILDNSIKEAGEYFKFPCPMKGTVKVGNNWAEVH